MIPFHLICILLFVSRRTCEVWHSNSSNNFKLSPWTLNLSTSLLTFLCVLHSFSFCTLFLLNDVLLQELRWGKNFVDHACSIVYSFSLSHKPLMLCCLSSLMLGPLSPLPKSQSSLAFFFHLIPWVSILKLRCEGACRCPGAESKVPHGQQFSRQAKAYTSPGMSFQNNCYTRG
jgi:hypothetical protein